MLRTTPVLLIALLPALTLAQRPATDFPLKVSEDRRHVVGQNGRPFLYNADTAWMLFLKLTAAEAGEYMTARKAQGFNAIQVQLTGFLDMADRHGNKPFGGTSDFAKPNEAFFAHVDEVVKDARSRGLVLAIAPLWAGCCGEGWAGRGKDGKPKPIEANGPEKCHALGRYLGKRYGGFDNVLWIMGGDNDPGTAKEGFRQLAMGLKETAPGQLITYHAASSHSSADVYDNEPWLDVVMIYTYFRGFNKAWNKSQPDVYEEGWRQYVRKPVKPFFLGESTYEGEHAAWGSALQARKQAYWSILSGGFGHAYGSPDWNFPKNWREVIELPGAKSLKHLHALFTSMPWHELEPDPKSRLIVAGAGEVAKNSYAVSAISRDGRFSVSYLPSRRKVTVDLGVLSADRVKARWFDAAKGEFSEAGAFPRGGQQDFEPPAEGDWVLLIEAE